MQEHIGWLDVAMQYVLVMGVVDGLSCLGEIAHCFFGGQRTVCCPEAVAQCAARDIGHDQVGYHHPVFLNRLTEIMYCENMGMLQSRRRACLVSKCIQVSLITGKD